MNFETLYKKAVLKNIISWNVATEPTTDSYAAESMANMEFHAALKSFMEANPNHPITFHNKDTIFSDILEERKIQCSQSLWKKYTAMKKAKQPVDEEYLKLFNDMVSVTKDLLISKGLQPTDLMVFNDNNLGNPAFVLDVVEKMAEVSKEFLKSKPKNKVEPLTDFKFEDLIKYIESFSDIGYKISNENGSFMTCLDKDNSRVHVAKNKKDVFDSASSITHEVGHALYQNRILNKQTDIGEIGQFVSLSLHESSSIVHEISLSGLKFDVTDTKDNLFRLGTDKVHYIIHIYIRMKIESMLFNNEIEAKDISTVWNSLVEEYIGIKPENDWEGFLQDVHWNSGAFGYFQSYAIGFLNAVTLYQRIENELTSDMVASTENVILPAIEHWYGHYNEYSFDILKDMHPNIEMSLVNYKRFIFENFNYKEA